MHVGSAGLRNHCRRAAAATCNFAQRFRSKGTSVSSVESRQRRNFTGAKDSRRGVWRFYPSPCIDQGGSWPRHKSDGPSTPPSSREPRRSPLQDGSGGPGESWPTTRPAAARDPPWTIQPAPHGGAPHRPHHPRFEASAVPSARSWQRHSASPAATDHTARGFELARRRI